MKGLRYTWFVATIILCVCSTLTNAQAGMFSLSEQDEISIGRQAAAQVEQKAHILRDPEVQHYISRLGMKLASVIAHEIGHVEGRHHKAQIEKAQRYQIGLGVLSAVVGHGSGSNAALIAGRLLAQGQLTKYSRHAEADADRRGVAILYRTGFDPMAMSRFLRNLVKLEHGNRDLLAGFFADHPAARDRVSSTRAQAQALPKKSWHGNSMDFLRISGKTGGKAGRNKFSGTAIHKKTGRYGGARIQPKGGIQPPYEGARIDLHTP